ncbi:type II 3-dehydroquinate dehydratase [Candidatus Berkiella aquae]|uniref:3-dehydroquinate dehydratase n=1 Tax=Candidatus Berkiella aquae TaxID=295108 RepID=A0A0Q9YN93_9GAMM|nr:type II 3-dehydroquinate dehydratase [Candidatus Berkiella aquae]MCS5712537.1 type II 3-dehydroquinate dehydratase [Candidatus Berkiella aquae]
MAKLLVIHGPNLNMLGNREPEHYGKLSLDEINKLIIKHAKKNPTECFQSNAEHEIIDKIQTCKADYLIINPGALTHTSIAIRDALIAVKIPFYEVHLSNIYARESFRHISYLSDIATGVVSGLGHFGYLAAIDAALASQS